MTTKNDNLDLSRSNPNSDEKGHLRGLCTDSDKSHDSRAIPKRFYQNGDVGIAYNTVDEIAQWLVEHPEQIVGYQGSMLDLANGLAGWGAYGTMRHELNHLVDVLVRVGELRGQRHMP